ncbi:MAG: Dabb family protein [Eubacteriales bacterium]|nr:Dabb family protein [Eubacteriales bacterium]
MVRHVVMWCFREELPQEERTSAKERIKRELEALVGVVPGLLSARVVTEPISSSSHDICLVAAMDSEESLRAYATNPDHVKAAQFVRSVTCGRAVMDYCE